MSNVHLLDEYLIVFRDAGRRHMACRIELERRLAELDRLRAIEAAARKLDDEHAEPDGLWVTVPILAKHWDELRAALAAKGGGK
jgi:hypothetical protein